MAAIPLLDGALHSTTLDLPTPPSQSLTTSTLDPILGSAAEDAVFAKIAELEHRNAHFLLLWALRRDSHTRVAGDMDGLAEHVIDLVSEEVQEYLSA